MANTYQNLFPFSTIDHTKALVYPVSVEFSAPIQAGYYVFNESTTPMKKFGKLLQTQTGVVAGVMIGGNCSPDDFASSVDSPLLLQIYHGSNKTPVNLAPFPFSQFAHGDNYSEWWNITGSNNDYEDDFMLSVKGKVRQISDMVDNELILKISFNFWRIDNDAIRKDAELTRNLERAFSKFFGSNFVE